MQRPPYYLTAYGIACAHGFQGTEEEWLVSITAYGLACTLGFEGSIAEWLESLKVKGDTGKSAYETAVEAGFEGNEQAFAEHLAKAGKTAYEYAVEGGYEGTPETFAAELSKLGKPWSIEDGGTGRSTAAEALAALGGLALAGGTMTGEIKMDDHPISGLPDPVNDGDAARKKFVEDTAKDTKDAIIKAFGYVVVSLPVSGWTADGKAFVQTVNVPGMTAAWKIGKITIVSNETDEEDEAMGEAAACITKASTGDGIITFRCASDKPEVDMNLEVHGAMEVTTDG